MNVGPCSDPDPAAQATNPVRRVDVMMRLAIELYVESVQAPACRVRVVQHIAQIPHRLLSARTIYVAH